MAGSPRDVAEVLIVLQNDFARSSAQDRFKIGRYCALMIQNSCDPIRLFQISIPLLRRGAFCNTICRFCCKSRSSVCSAACDCAGPCGAQFEFTLAAIAQNLRRLAKFVA